MASSRRTRRRRQQKSLHRHHLRLEGLEKRYALDADPIVLIDADIDLADAAPVTFNDDTIFTTNRRFSGDNELWITNGSPSGTSLLKSFDSTAFGTIRNITRVDDQVFFTAYDNSSGRELWVTDGTADGTRLALDVFPGESANFGLVAPNSSEAKYLTATENGLFFVANQGNGERVFHYDPTSDSLSPLSYADGSDIILVSTSPSESFYANSHSLANDHFVHSLDPLTNGGLLSDGRYLYLFTPNPRVDGWFGSSYNWIRYDSATGNTSNVVDNQLEDLSYELQVGARVAFQDGIYAQLSSRDENGIYVIRRDNPTPIKIVDIPIGTSVHRLAQHEDWIYAEIPFSNIYDSTAQEIVRFRLNGGSYETVAEVVPSEGVFPADRIQRGLKILGSTGNGLLFVEGTQITSGPILAYSTVSTSITLKVHTRSGEIVDIPQSNFFTTPGWSFDFDSMLRRNSAYSWQNGGIIADAVFFKAMVTDEAPIGSGGMGGSTGRKVFVSDGSAEGTFEVVSRGNNPVVNNAWRVGAINNKLLFENHHFYPSGNSSGGGIYSLQPRGTETLYLNPLPNLTVIENSAEQTVLLSGIASSSTNQQPLRITVLSSNTGLIPDPSVAYSSPDTTGNISFTPVADQFGTATITVTVEDEQNVSFFREFTVTVVPVNDSPTMDELENPVWYGSEFQDRQVTFTVGGITAGGNEYEQPLEVNATSSNPTLVTPPESLFLEGPAVYPPEPYSTAVTYTIKAGHSGTSIITLTVEDGGLDNDLSTLGDNAFTSRESDVTVLLVISGDPSITTEVNKAVPGDQVLARDVDNNIFVDSQPVIYNQQQVPQVFFGSSVVSAYTSDSGNALMLKPLGADAEDPPTHRLLTDETWRINGIFNSLQNASSPVLDLSGREVSVPLNIAAVAGAYEINGVNNPTLIVRRGQTYTFNLNTAGHPFYLQTTGGGYQSANTYADGFTGNNRTSGEYRWVVPQDAPDEIFYQCKFHPVMFGKIIVVD